jgi:hypothetical protein
MIYFEANQPHIAVWPYLAVAVDGEFWIGLGWLDFELGWRRGDGGDREQDPLEKDGAEE